MLYLTVTESPSAYFAQGSLISSSSNQILKYNFATDIINYSLSIESSVIRLHLIPRHYISTYSMSLKVRIIIVFILFICCTIPILNIIAFCFLIGIDCSALYLSSILKKNRETLPDPFSRLINYEDLCRNEEGEEVPALALQVDFSQFQRESNENQKILQETFDLRSLESSAKFVAYRKEVENWLTSSLVQKPGETLGFLVITFLGLFLVVIINYAVLSPIS